MALTFPRDVVAEVYLPGRGWTEITALPESRGLRQAEPLSIARGRTRVTERASPGSLSGTLNNTGGHWTPDNPMSDYSGLFGQNTPFRLSLRIAKDTFDGRTVANNWGTSSGGDVWSVTNATDYAVSGGRASQSVGASGSFTYAWLAGVRARDCWQRISFNMADTNITGADVEPATLLFRYLDANNYYMVRPTVTAAEVIQLKILCRVGGTDFVLGTFTAPTVWGAGADLTVVGQIEAETIRAKIFSSLAVEPYAWDITVHNDFLPYVGAVGVRLGVAAGNTNAKPFAATYDNYEARDIRHCGEVFEVNPDTDESHKIKKAALMSKGVLARIGVPARPVMKSAAYRYAMAASAPFTLTDYWELEAGPASGNPGSSANGGSAGLFERETGLLPNTGAIKWGTAPGNMPSIVGAAELTAGGRLTMTVRNAPLGTGYSVMWAQRLSADAGGKVFLHNTNATQDITLIFYTDGLYEVYLATATPLSPLLLFSGRLDGGAGFDDMWHVIGFAAYNAGASTGFVLTVDGAIGTTSVAATTYAPLKDVMVTAPPGTTAPCVYAQVIVFPDRLDLSNRWSLLRAAILGYPGETAGRRLERLCAEEGISFDWSGAGSTLDQTEAMGPQGIGKLVDALWECAEAERGDLYELRSVVGLGLRALQSMQAQVVRVTMNYAAGQLAKPLDTRRDPRVIRNKVTARRRDGGEYTAEQTSGPLNTNDPGSDPNGVGIYTDGPTLNLYSDLQLPDAAGWRLAQGTVQESRRPVLRVNLRASEVATLTPDLVGLNIGDRIMVQNLQSRDVYRDLDLIVIGIDEVFTDTRMHELRIKTEPYEPYRTAVYTDGVSRYDTLGSQFDTSLTTTFTGTRAVSTTAGVLWTTDAADFPLDIECEGEKITISTITGATSPQTFTISARSGNGVVKAHLAGATIRLWQPSYFG